MLIDLKELTKSLDITIESLSSEFSSLRSNRPNAKMVEDILVDVYGSKIPVKQIASISITPPKEINISAWDINNTKSILNAIIENLKLNPRVDGSTIHVEIQSLTDERKNEIIKIAGKLAEEARIKIRSLRDSANKKIESEAKEGSISEDEKFSHKEKIQKIIDQINNKVETLLKNKIEDLKI
ncbi:MAG: ribosome recycling factor [Candidatus Liptonbacteria bacterium CG11_big_fil_rev_8_21_14_0_20_35_14]|uniref:Ribosome recycling factor n=1 Tax=Candidatus Liptonbacteria bacterium CG11_big_fil_rev_8_21_14_0_20_35_14 TaxID=1974634 RepID=A0A2H0N7H2_9BACT|nr:MAG: ribosome recycling factor [Candidatus Liptonbacteria bacterium CG11_big_fil_rev_8_21_14_0_20_35_14]